MYNDASNGINRGIRIDRRAFLKLATVLGGSAAFNFGSQAAEAAGVGRGFKSSIELFDSKPVFSITGVPDSVAKSAMAKTANEATPAKGDVPHKNEILFGTEHFMAEPGTRTHSDLGVGIDPKTGKPKWSEAQAQQDLKDIDSGVCWKTAENRETFTHQDFPFLIPGEGFAMITGAGLRITFPDGQSAADITLGARQGHTWFAVIKGLPRDYKRDTDENVILNADDIIDPGAVNGTRLPPGQYFSQDYFKQNVAAAHGNRGTAINCGIDGCTGVSALFFDVRTGGFTVINQATPEANWTLVKTNLK